jgi:hypothetical protein
MMISAEQILTQLSELSSPSDVGYRLEELMTEASQLKDPALLQAIYDRAKILSESNYKANIVLWTCLAIFFEKKREAQTLFQSTKLDDPEEFDDVYSDACRLLEVCDCTEDEIDNLQRDAEVMFDDDGVFQSDWQDKL